MIKGDIDLTENLDFRKDKQLPSVRYRNDSAFNILSTLDSKEELDNSEYGLTTQEFRYMYNMALTTGFDNIRNYSSHTIYNLINTYTSNDYDYWRNDDWTFIIDYNHGRTIIRDMSNNLQYYYTEDEMKLTREYIYNTIKADNEKSNNDATKLFGSKKSWIRYYNANLGDREKEYYENTDDFSERISHASQWLKRRAQVLQYQSGWKNLDRYLEIYHCDDIDGENNSTYLKYLFGIKKKPEECKDDKHLGWISSKSKFDRVPWIKELKDRNRNAYEYYIEELEGNEKDYSSYLTNMNWLRLH